MSEEVKELQQTVVCSSGLLGVCSFGTSHRGGGREREQDPNFLDSKKCYITLLALHTHTTTCAHTRMHTHTHTTTCTHKHHTKYTPTQPHTHTHTHTHTLSACINKLSKYLSSTPPPPKKMDCFQSAGR